MTDEAPDGPITEHPLSFVSGFQQRWSGDLRGAPAALRALADRLEIDPHLTLLTVTLHWAELDDEFVLTAFYETTPPL
jgi:hypothetical protein